MFPIITKEIQKEFETANVDRNRPYVPEICGYYGRACRQMGKDEGANRMNCTSCALAKFAEKGVQKEK